MQTLKYSPISKKILSLTNLEYSARCLSTSRCALNTFVPPSPKKAPSSTSSSKAPMPTKRKLRYGLGGIVAFFVIGSTIGYYTLPHAIPSLVTNTQLPEPGSTEESNYLQKLEAQIRQVPIVRELDRDPEWNVLRAWNLILENDSPTGLVTPDSHSFAAKLLGRPGGIGVPPIIFSSTDENNLPMTVTVIHCGAYLSGFPAIVHGGILGTFLEETMGRIALKCPETQSSVPIDKENASSILSKGQSLKPWWKVLWWGDSKTDISNTSSNGYNEKFTGLKSLSINYKNPTLVDQFIVIKAKVKEVQVSEGKYTIDIDGIVENTKGKKLIVASGSYEGYTE